MLLEKACLPKRSGWTRKKKGLKAVETSALERHLLKIRTNYTVEVSGHCYLMVMQNLTGARNVLLKDINITTQHHNIWKVPKVREWIKHPRKGLIFFIVTFKSQNLCKVQTGKRDQIISNFSSSSSSFLSSFLRSCFSSCSSSSSPCSCSCSSHVTLTWKLIKDK